MILIVGDDDEVAQVLRRSVWNLGYLPIWARDGREALSAMTHQRPAMVVIDLGSRVDGVRLLAKMDGSPLLARIPRAVVTGHGYIGFVGLDSWALWLKPIDLERLARLIRRIGVMRRLSAVG